MNELHSSNSLSRAPTRPVDLDTKLIGGYCWMKGTYVVDE